MQTRSSATSRPPARPGAVLGRALGCAPAILLLGLTLGACGASARESATAHVSPPALAAGAATSAGSAAAPEAPCGAATAATAADTAGAAAERIYRTELASSEVGVDRRQVEGDRGLLEAMAAGSRAATTEAVTRLVYSGTHIVRLRVTRGGNVLADVGGPYI